MSEKEDSESGLRHRLSDNVTSFAQRTSIKGVPRIVTSEARYIRVLWVVAVIFFFFLTAFNLTNLCREYFESTDVVIAKVCQYIYSTFALNLAVFCFRKSQSLTKNITST